MKSVFADTFYFIALLNPDDLQHATAGAFSQSFDGKLITTGWILTELGDGMARPPWRETFVALRDDLLANPNVRIVPCSEELQSEGVELYRRRPDKEWSLTDCISFVVMQSEGITEALTGDHHFEQAGFIALLKST